MTSGLVEPRHICVSLPRRLRNVRFVLGMVTDVDPQAKTVHWDSTKMGADLMIPLGPPAVAVLMAWALARSTYLAPQPHRPAAGRGI